MSNADSLFQSVGALSFPVDVDALGGNLVPLDPAKSTLAALFKAAINAELGDAWREAVKTAGGKFGTDPVTDTLELMPTPSVMQQRKADWPLLCVHRNPGATFDQVTLFEERKTTQWSVHYILGPMDVASERKLTDIFVAVENVIMLVIRQRGHRSYQNGALQFFPGTGHLATLWPKTVDGPGPAKFADSEDGPTYFAMTITLESTENTDEDNDVYGNFDGTDFSVGVGGEEEIAPDLLQGDSSVAVELG